ncbi:MAG: DNA mismatch repair protein MutS [Planctomycetota bacterium]|jgi:DNA mismatch repair protein MutS
MSAAKAGKARGKGSSKGAPTLTPLMRQYRSIKDEHRDKVLLFHLGDFYEMFDEDAKTASRALGITLTSRSGLALAGFPVHAARDHIEKLLEAGHKVAICDQVEDPKKAKGIVRREVTRVITAGTLLDEGMLRADENNFLAAVSSDGDRGGLAYVDLSTGEFAVAEFRREALAEELERLRPAEILVPEAHLRDGKVFDEEPPEYGRPGGGGDAPEPTPYPDWAFDTETARRKLIEHFRVKTLDAFGCDDMELAQSAAGALLRYLEETHRAGVDHITGLSVVDSGAHLAFDGEALRNLEVLETIRDRSKEGSLLGVLDRTCTAPGARRLRQWLVRPLAELEAIMRRQDAVAELVREHAVRARVREALSNVQDLERLSAKLAAGRVNARDLLGIAGSIERLPELASALDGARAEALAELGTHFGEASRLTALAEHVRATLVEGPPVSVKDGGLIADGVNADLDRLREVRAGGRSWIAEFQTREQERTGIGSLKVGYNKVFGYFIEVTKANLANVPDGYERKQTLVNAERFITPELKEREAEVLGAEEKILALEYELFCALRDEVAAELPAIHECGGRVGDLDALASFAEVAADRGYVRPELDESLVLEIEDGRHPVLEMAMDAGTFVPNDIEIDAERRQVLIVTGPNMAGKSTFIRQVALTAAMAQMGSFVPAKRARVGIVDRIFARVGASDDLSRGRSTFMVEMVETARVLRTATERSLVVLDEVGRGTSTYDGVSIAWAVTEHIHDSVGARTLFATHYHELCASSEELERVANVNVAVREWGDEITFLYRIVPGGADRSYGIHVARLAGVPREVIDRAKEILELLESRSEAPVEQGKKRRKGKGKGPRMEQMPLFIPVPAPAAPPKPSAVEEALSALKIENLTPLEALVKLEELRKLLGKKPE